MTIKIEKRDLIFTIIGGLITLFVLQLSGNFYVDGANAESWREGVDEWAQYGNYCLQDAADLKTIDCPDFSEMDNYCRCQEFDIGCDY